MAQAVPGEPGLLRIGAPPFRVHPVTSGVDTLFVGGREAEGREFRIGGHIPTLVNVFSDQPSDVSIAADKVMGEERMRCASFIGYAV